MIAAQHLQELSRSMRHSAVLQFELVKLIGCVHIDCCIVAWAGPQQGKITRWVQSMPPAKRRKVNSQADTPPRESLDDVFS